MGGLPCCRGPVATGQQFCKAGEGNEPGNCLEMLCFVQVVSPFLISLFTHQICFAAVLQQCCVAVTASHPEASTAHIPFLSLWPLNVAGA